MSLSTVLASLGLKPKNLEEARQTIEPARATLDAVNALFTTAGLNLETLLAAGPESLKAHLASLDNAAQVATLTENLTIAQADVTKLNSTIDALRASNTTASEIFATIGLPLDKISTAALEAAAVKTAFETHVAKQVTLANAKIGHPPVVHIDAAAAPAAEQLSDEAHLAAYEKLEGSEAKAYLSANAQALWRADIARRTQRR